MKVTLFATAWGAKHGGINAFNRDFAVGLAAVLGTPGAVTCIVLASDPADEADAAKHDVSLLGIGKSGEVFDRDWTESVKRVFGTRGISTDGICWVGHDMTSGEIAVAAAERFGGSSAIIHHMHYRAYAALKSADAVAADTKATRQESFFEGASSSALFSVGPLLRKSCQNMTRRTCTSLIPGFPPVATENESDVGELHALTFGRMERGDDRIKQGRLAAAAFGRAVRQAHSQSGGPSALQENPELMILGLSVDKHEEESELRDLVNTEANRAVNVFALPFDTDRGNLFRRLKRANLALMLSLREGFGLTGWEAIAFEVPLILSKNSGLHTLIAESLGGAGLGCVKVINVRGSITDNAPYHPDDVQTIADAYSEAAPRLSQMKQDAARLKQLLVGVHVCTWEHTAKQFLDAMRSPSLVTKTSAETPSNTEAADPSATKLTITTQTPSQTFNPQAIARPTRCFGRADDISALTEMLVRGGTTAVVALGPGGIGKTTLTQQVANESAVVAHFPRRVFVTLEAAQNADAMVAAIRSALGLDPAVTLDGMLGRFGDVATLLVLDNLETPWLEDAEATELVLSRLGAEPSIALFASMRGESAPREPRWDTYHLAGLSAEHASAMFRDFAQRIQQDDPHLPMLIEQLGGMPLAIRLVARRATGLTRLEALWDEWLRQGVDLASDPDLAAGRLTDVGRSILFSLEAKPVKAAGKRLFSVLGQLPAGLLRKDRDALLKSAGFEAQRQLLEVGLAIEKDGRVDLLPPVRDLARRRYPPTGKDTTAWAAHFLTETSQHVWSRAGATAMQRLLPELPNIEHAVMTCHALGLVQQGIAAVSGLINLLVFSGRRGDALDALAKACRATNNDNGEAHCLLGLAHIARSRSETTAAGQTFEAALQIYRAVGNRKGEADCLLGFALIATNHFEHAQAWQGFEGALQTYRAIGDLHGEADCLFGFAKIALARSEEAIARQGFESAMKTYRAIGQLLGEANCRMSLAELARASSEHATAEEGYAAALQMYQAWGDHLGKSHCILGVARIALSRSQHVEARNGFEAALPISRAIGNPVVEAICRLGLGRVALAESVWTVARTEIMAALSTFRQLSSVWNEADALGVLGDLERDTGDTGAAAVCYQQSEEAFRRIGNEVKANESRALRLALA